MESEAEPVEVVIETATQQPIDNIIKNEIQVCLNKNCI